MSGSSNQFPDRGPTVFAVVTATLVLCSIFVFSRLVCRLGIVHRVGWDDYFIILAWFLAFGLGLTINIGTRNGLGLHDVNIRPEHWNTLRICEYVFSILYNPALMATKTSILIFYIRLSKNTQRFLHLGSYIVLAIVNIAGVVLTFMNIFQCRPIYAAYSDTAGACIPLLTEFICSAPVNIITDLAILALPIPTLTNMQLPSRQKTILVFTFALGIFVTVVDVVRIYYLQQAIDVVKPGMSSDPNAIFGNSINFSFNASLAFMWSAVEVNISITCTCIPTLKPLIIKILPAILIAPDKSSNFNSPGAGDPDVLNTTSRHHTISPLFSVPISSQRSPRTATARGTSTPDVTPTRATTAAAADGATTLIPSAQTGLDGIHASADARTSATTSSFNLNLDLDSSVDADSSPDRSSIPSLRQAAATGGPMTPAGPYSPPATHSPLARVASSTRNSLATVTDILHVSTSTTSRRGKKETSVYFGFVKLKTPKRMLDASVSESFKYCTVITVLFFLWGFSQGLLSTLNSSIAAVANMTTAQTVGLTSAYFGGGYFFGPLLVGQWVLRHDEHRRRRSTGLQQQPQQQQQQHSTFREGRTATLSSIQATATTVASAAASVVTRPLHSPSSVEQPIGGFKATFITGLCVYGVGTIMFWPSAVLASFPGFLICTFVVGFGLSILETAANPFVVLCGPQEYGEMRLLLVQGVTTIGAVLGSLLAQKLLFVNVGTAGTTSSTTLLNVQWTYLSITLLCAALAMFFYYMPLPEVHDAELERAAGRLPVDGTKRTNIFGCGLQLRTVCLALAVFAQWTYMACQENFAIYFENLITSWLPGAPAPAPASSESGNSSNNSNGSINSAVMLLLSERFPTTSAILAMAASSISPRGSTDDPAGLALSVMNFLLICRTVFTLSRFFAGGLVYLGVKHPGRRWLPAPRTILGASIALMFLFALLAVVLRPGPDSNANLIVVPTALYSMAEGPVWPLVFSIGLRGQGARTKRAAAFITMGASAPLFWPYVMYAIIEAGGSIQTAFIVDVALIPACMIYPLYLTLVRDARELTKVSPLYPPQPPAAAMLRWPGEGGAAAAAMGEEGDEAAAAASAVGGAINEELGAGSGPSEHGPADEEKGGGQGIQQTQMSSCSGAIPDLGPMAEPPTGHAPTLEENVVASTAASASSSPQPSLPSKLPGSSNAAH